MIGTAPDYRPPACPTAVSWPIPVLHVLSQPEREAAR
jgi:hypothetical protein